jgi:hypothetical protein
LPLPTKSLVLPLPIMANGGPKRLSFRWRGDGNAAVC